MSLRTLSTAIALALSLCALPAAAQLLPQDYNGISFVSGGVGVDERTELETLADQYSLRLEFAQTSGAYLSSIRVTIQNAAGESVFETTASEPWLLVNLPAGDYRVAARSGENTVEESVKVPAKGQKAVVLRFPES